MQAGVQSLKEGDHDQPIGETGQDVGANHYKKTEEMIGGGDEQICKKGQSWFKSCIIINFSKSFQTKLNSEI